MSLLFKKNLALLFIFFKLLPFILICIPIIKNVLPASITRENTRRVDRQRWLTERPKGYILGERELPAFFHFPFFFFFVQKKPRVTKRLSRFGRVSKNGTESDNLGACADFPSPLSVSALLPFQGKPGEQNRQKDLTW